MGQRNIGTLLRIAASVRHEAFSLLSGESRPYFHLGRGEESRQSPFQGGEFLFYALQEFFFPLSPYPPTPHLLKAQPEERAVHPEVVKGNRKLTINVIN